MFISMFVLDHNDTTNTFRCTSRCRHVLVAAGRHCLWHSLCTVSVCLQFTESSIEFSLTIASSAYQSTKVVEDVLPDRGCSLLALWCTVRQSIAGDACSTTLNDAAAYVHSPKRSSERASRPVRFDATSSAFASSARSDTTVSSSISSSLFSCSASPVAVGAVAGVVQIC